MTQGEAIDLMDDARNNPALENQADGASAPKDGAGSQELIDRVRRAMLTLAGMSVEQIADFCRAQNITGIQSRTRQCPVARYLSRESGTACWAYSRYGYDKDGLGSCPPEVTKFADAFDAGLFPDLIEAVSPTAVQEATPQ